MGFEIDTGFRERTIADLIPDWFQDQYAAQPSPEKLAHDYGYHLSSALKNPKTLDTSRKHLIAQWAFVRELAALHPAVFDELIVSYAEIVQGGE